MLFLPQFGAAPEGARLERIVRSPNFKNGQFRNALPTPVLSRKMPQFGLLLKFFLGGNSRVKPKVALPCEKHDLGAIPAEKNVVVWLGHSSYFLQIDGVKFLIDPVLSGSAAPFSFAVKNFSGSNPYGPEDMPLIDHLVITHDHYDHLDYRTVKAIAPKVKNVITGLGVGAHLEHWGYAPEKIVEFDWYDAKELPDGVRIVSVPARHFSGRLLRNRTLWNAFVLESKTKKVFVGGDGGYGPHFAEIGNTFGSFDLAVLENGQYNENWKYIHAAPEETAAAARDLRAHKLLPVHWGKFVLSIHDWDEPIRRLMSAMQQSETSLLTPMIGSVVDLDQKDAVQVRWWEGLR